MISAESKVEVVFNLWGYYRTALEKGSFKDPSIVKKLKESEAYYQNKYAELMSEINGSNVHVLPCGKLVTGTS